MTRGFGPIRAAVAMAGACVCEPAAHAGEDFAAMNAVPEAGIHVVLNQAKIVKLSQPAATVIIGNPEIADATVRDSRTLVLTGRGFGQTNLVILDRAGNPISVMMYSRSDRSLSPAALRLRDRFRIAAKPG